MKKFFKDFGAFLKRGNVLDLAVAVVIGSAFTAIVNALVKQILMPLISLISPKGFDGMYVGLVANGVATTDTTLANGAVIPAGETVYKAYLYYGLFIQAIIDFILIAFVIFCIVRTINAVEAKSKKTLEAINAKAHAQEIAKAKEEEAAKKAAEDAEAARIALLPKEPTTNELLQEILLALKKEA